MGRGGIGKDFFFRRRSERGYLFYEVYRLRQGLADVQPCSRAINSVASFCADINFRVHVGSELQFRVPLSAYVRFRVPLSAGPQFSVVVRRRRRRRGGRKRVGRGISRKIWTKIAAMRLVA